MPANPASGDCACTKGHHDDQQEDSMSKQQHAQPLTLNVNPKCKPHQESHYVVARFGLAKEERASFGLENRLVRIFLAGYY